LNATKHESPDVAVMIWVGFTTGMRFGELSAPTRDDVDFESGVIHVRRSQVYGVVGPTKTNSMRLVPLHPMVGNAELHASKKASSSNGALESAERDWSPFGDTHLNAPATSLTV
jgi:integrase